MDAGCSVFAHRLKAGAPTGGGWYFKYRPPWVFSTVRSDSYGRDRARVLSEESVVLVSCHGCRPVRELDGMPAGMALAPHAGGRRSRPAQWSTPAGSPVEDAANFDSPPLP